MAVDNTFLGPVFQHPLQHWRDLVVYSATKYLAGNSDMLAGVVLGDERDLIASLRGTRAILGNILQPDECWMLDSRLPTVELRMNRQSKNAQRIAEALAKHPEVEVMYYPTLFTDPEQSPHPRSAVRLPGGMFAFDVKGGKAAAFDFLRRLRSRATPSAWAAWRRWPATRRTTTHSELSRTSSSGPG